jgi:hypothetical protein
LRFAQLLGLSQRVFRSPGFKFPDSLIKFTKVIAFWPLQPGDKQVSPDGCTQKEQQDDQPPALTAVEMQQVLYFVPDTHVVIRASKLSNPKGEIVLLITFAP